MRQIHTEIEIEASPSQVWAALTDFARFHEWNPFVVGIQGRVAVGERLVVRIVLPGKKKPQTFKPVVRDATAPQRLSWRGVAAGPWLFAGAHNFEIIPLGDGRCRFVQSETFTGILVPLLWPAIGRGTREGFELMNRSLKQRVELRREG